MEREALLAVSAAAFFGIVVWMVALPAGWTRLRIRDAEKLAWWRLVLPLFAWGLVLAFFVGWALQEPDPSDERVGTAFHLLAALTGLIVLRALVRSMQALRGNVQTQVPIGTVGLVMPRIVVSAEFRQAASQDVLAAAMAHEAAHVRHRDPLRIWLAQLAADLQWPVAGTARRFSAWLLALEAERDSEAVASGADADDLAEAILAAARLQRGHRARLCANATGAGEGIAWRVRRLLSAEPSEHVRCRSWTTAASSIGLVIVASFLGFHYGDVALRMILGAGP